MVTVMVYTVKTQRLDFFFLFSHKLEVWLQAKFSYWLPESSIVLSTLNISCKNQISKCTQMHFQSIKSFASAGPPHMHKKLIKSRWCVLDQRFTTVAISIAYALLKLWIILSVKLAGEQEGVLLESSRSSTGKLLNILKCMGNPHNKE